MHGKDRRLAERLRRRAAHVLLLVLERGEQPAYVVRVTRPVSTCVARSRNGDQVQSTRCEPLTTDHVRLAAEPRVRAHLRDA